PDRTRQRSPARLAISHEPSPGRRWNSTPQRVRRLASAASRSAVVASSSLIGLGRGGATTAATGATAMAALLGATPDGRRRCIHQVVTYPRRLVPSAPAVITTAATSTAAAAGWSQRRMPAEPDTSRAAWRAVPAGTRRLVRPKAPSGARAQLLVISRATPPERRWITRSATAVKIICRCPAIWRRWRTYARVSGNVNGRRWYRAVI